MTLSDIEFIHECFLLSEWRKEKKHKKISRVRVEHIHIKSHSMTLWAEPEEVLAINERFGISIKTLGQFPHHHILVVDPKFTLKEVVLAIEIPY